ncbi:MAG: hypothetical protein EFT35_05200 [Methanophagales archaeon ANME-1-THS]|nr:MAG: hypothetical protein EFT35_05200 [Methanophagales archaeon ANME-1-THS]
MDKDELLLPFVLLVILSLSALTAPALSSNEVESLSTRLDTLPTVDIGEPLVVTGTTNRAEGTQILVTVKGPVELVPAIVRVENGTYKATFDTSAAQEGRYVITVDDGEGHTSEAMVNLREPLPEQTPPVRTEPPAPSPSPTPGVTPLPTVRPTPTPEAKVPGFEAGFALAGLFTVYLIRLRRN